MTVVALTAKRAAELAQSWLASAKAAQKKAEVAKAEGNTADVRYWMESVRLWIQRARDFYQYATLTGQLTHHYKAWNGAWRAVVRCDGVAVWIGRREYGKRQSAQRAAAKRLTGFLLERALPA